MLLDNKELKILKEFTGDYSTKNYGRKLASELKMNQKTVSNVLNSLEKQHILKFTQEGKNKYYYINKSNPFAKEIIKLIEINKKIIFLKEYNKLNNLFLEIEKRSRGLVIIFGSYANLSSSKNSDIDIFAMGKVDDTKDLEELYNIKINVINSSKDKFKLNDIFVKEIINNHIILKGVEEYIDLTW
jgi:predicted nucleotidyltransferase